MQEIAGFWLCAARFTGRLDFVSMGDAVGGVELLPGLPAAALRRAGAAIDQAAMLALARPATVEPAFVTLADSTYPQRLRNTPFAPPVLFYRGELARFEAPAVAIVGARNCTGSGARMARQLARSCAQAGVVVISGMAFGIDTAAHLAADGRTIAVLGQGLCARRTRAQAATADGLLDAGGLLLSEFPPDHPAARHTFPLRNRVIAGLADATVVVEAGRRSGALITARRALELGREVLAVPGSPLSEQSSGCLDLIEQGARMVRSGRDLRELVGHGPEPAHRRRPVHALLSQLDDAPTFDALMARSGLGAADLAQVLAGLELTGLVERLPGDRYSSRGSE